ncbi:hypothetical protein EAI_07481, partial [Harpegnathos saltator]
VSHPFITERAMTERTEFCKIINEMFENRDLHKKSVIYTDEAYFWLNDIKDNCYEI